MLRRFNKLICLSCLLLLLLTGISSVLAQSGGVGDCSQTHMTAPSNDTAWSHADVINFTWEGEPLGTFRRVWMAYSVGQDTSGQFIGTGVSFALDAGPNQFRAIIPEIVGHPNASGTFNWRVDFYDANNQLICSSIPGWIDVRGGTSAPPSPPAEGNPPPPPVTVVVLAACTNGETRTIVISGSPYAGAADVVLPLGVYDYDANADPRMSGCKLIIHGNNTTNRITGGPQDDVIYGYDLLDILYGGAGNDIIYGGDHVCNGCGGGGSRGDEIYGGDGDDTLYGGDESCGGVSCNDNAGLGDWIYGEAGNDTIYGGNESCTGDYCNNNSQPRIGDVILGGDGDDTIYGGDESCNGTLCNENGEIGDIIDGGTGTDTADGGTLSSTGGNGNVDNTCANVENTTNC